MYGEHTHMTHWAVEQDKARWYVFVCVTPCNVMCKVSFPGTVKWHKVTSYFTFQWNAPQSLVNSYCTHQRSLCILFLLIMAAQFGQNAICSFCHADFFFLVEHFEWWYDKHLIFHIAASKLSSKKRTKRHAIILKPDVQKLQTQMPLCCQ